MGFLIIRYVRLSFFFKSAATPVIYTLSLTTLFRSPPASSAAVCASASIPRAMPLTITARRSEEHTSELQSRLHLVCRLLLEKKKQHLAPWAPDPHCRFCKTRNASPAVPAPLSDPSA